MASFHRQRSLGSGEKAKVAMKLAYVIPRFGTAFSSNEIHVQLCQALQDIGVDVNVFAFAVKGDTGGIATEELAPAGGPAGVLARLIAGGLTGYTRLLDLVSPLQRAMAHYRPQVAHIEGAFPAGVIYWLAFPRGPVPSVVSLQGTDIIRRPDLGLSRLDRLAVRWLVVRALRSATVVRANSPATARILGGLVAHPRTYVVPRNIAMRYFAYSLEQATDLHPSARRRLATHIPIGSVPLIAAFGRLHPCKGFEQLLEASARLHALGFEHKLLIAGPDSPEIQRKDNYRQRLRDLAHRLGLGPSTILLGSVDEEDMPNYYAASNVVVVPSILEGFNKVAVEAAALARPVVVSDGAGVHTYFAEHGAGIVVPAGDVSALTEALIRLLTDQAESSAIAARGYQMARLFTPRKVAEALMAALEASLQ